MQNQQQSMESPQQLYSMSEDAVEAEIEPYSQQNYDNYEYNVPCLQSHNSQYSEPPALSYSYSGISNASYGSSAPQLAMISSRVSEEQVQHFLFHKPQKIFTSLYKLIKQVRELIVLQDDLIMYILFKYQWNKQKLLQNYYSSCSIYQQANNLLKQPQPQPQLPTLCPICQTCSPLLSNGLCSHKYCHGCWKQYLQQSLKQNNPFPSCMQKCEVSPLLLHSFAEKYFGELYQLYRKVICINYASVNKAITYCPGDKCEVFCQRVESAYDVFVECPCGEFFCFNCRKEPHYPAFCDDVLKWNKLINDQSACNEWISKNTKVCPSCKRPVEKYIGCSKIKCICGAVFCYQCNAKWDQNHKSSKDQCLSLSRKSSLQERTSTPSFLQLHQKSMAISRTLKKHLQILSTVFQYIKEEWMMNKFNGLKKQIIQAWLALKWGNIVSFIFKRNQVDTFIQEDFIEAINNVMNSVEKMKNIANLISAKDMIGIADQVLTKRECLKKNKEIWSEAWRSCN